MNLNLNTFLTNIQSAGGIAMLIGGAVIDEIQGRPIKDWDMEVYHLDLNQLEEILNRLGLKADTVGKSFGVIKTRMEVDGEMVEVDLSIPRMENKIGVGHKDFQVDLDPNMSPEEAGRRRDLTINSMYKNLHTGAIVDPFNGFNDLKNGVLRVTNEATFVEDPLRVLRIMQLLPRKGKTVEVKSVALCRTMVDDFKHLPKERVFEEFSKLLLKADKPSMGLEFLRDCGWIVHFPELKNLDGCPQNPVWHPEGDVWVHTMMVVDNAALLRDQVPEDWRLAYMFGALLHDIGKPDTTVLPRCTAHGHDRVGAELSIEFMHRLTDDKRLIDRVERIVRLHMRPGQLFRSKAKGPAWRKVHNQLRLDILGWMAMADSAGRTGRSIKDVNEGAEKCFTYFEKLGAKRIPPLVLGRDLIAAGMKPGPAFKEILANAYELQMNGMDKVEEILEQLAVK